MKCEIFTKSWPYTALILSHAIWGVNFIIAKITLQEIPTMSLAFLRFFLALLLLLPFIIADKKRDKIKKEDLPKLFAVGVLMVTLNITFFYTGLERTTITQASVLTLVIPLLSVFAGWAFLKEKIYTLNLAGIALGFLGALLVIGLPLLLLGSQLNPQVMLGNFLIILASISWVSGALISKRMLKNYSTLTITSFIFLIGALTFAIPAAIEYFQNPSWPTQVTFLGIFGLLFIIIAASISAYFLFEWGLSRVGLVKADLFQYLEPIIAISLGVLILTEPLRLSFIFGAILIGVGAYLSTLSRVEHKHHKAHRT